jgi:AraC-like DNA-binding protein
MSVAFTTDELDERDRIAYWVDVASKTFYSHAFEAPGAAFAGRIHSRALDSLALTVCDCGPCVVTRTRRDTLRDDVDNYIVSLRLEGRSLFTQDDRTVVVAPGTVLLHDVGKPLALEFLEQTRSIHVSIPRRLVQSRIASPDSVMVMSETAPVVGLAADFIRSLVNNAGRVDDVVKPRIASQVVDLLALAISGDVRGMPMSSARTNALRRIKAEIEKRLRDPNLRPSTAAGHAGMSVRYANALLAEEGSSLERYILHRRLEQCRRAIEDPLQANRMIGEIAFSWGFSDHSHFTRRFRDAFGLTPRECRELARCEV